MMTNWFAAFIAVTIGATGIAKAATFTCSNGSDQRTNVSAEKPPLCSRNFLFSGTCDQTEQISPLREPWLPVSIDIVGVTLALNVMTTGQFSGYALAGNNYDPDVMGWVLANGVKDTWYPPGYVFRFNGVKSQAQHIDAHVWCSPSGAAFQLFETIYYVAPGAADVQAASKLQ